MKNSLNKIIKISAIFSLIFAISCSKGKIESKKTDSGNLPDLPSWVLNPEINDGIAAVGISSSSKGGIKFQLQNAKLDAKANIASRIQSEISRVSKNALRSAKVNENDDVEEFFTQATKEVVKNLPLSGVKQINIFRDKEGTLYVHMKLSNEDYSSFLKNGEDSFKARLNNSKLSRENIDKSQEATKEIFEELEKERQ
jgi:hypothetical protein